MPAFWDSSAPNSWNSRFTAHPSVERQPSANLAGSASANGAVLGVVGQFEGMLFSRQSQPERARQTALQAYALHTQNDSQREEDDEDEPD